MPARDPVAAGAIQLVRHPLRLRRLKVSAVRMVTPRMRRVTLAGPELEGFVSAAPEDHVRLFFPAPGEDEPALPGENDLAAATGANPRIVARDYTPLHHDPTGGTLEIDFFLHGQGPAAAWAERARPGQVLGLLGPRGSHVLRASFDWHLLAGDETALPEMAGRLAALPPTCRALAVLAVRDAGEEQALWSAAPLDLRWVHRPGPQAGSSSPRVTPLLDQVRRLELPPGEGLCWLAGEASEVRAIYRHLVGERGLDRSRIRASGHWKRGVANHDHHEAIDLPPGAAPGTDPGPPR
jgi:NADPH-dependent ferric siderophore reductase